MAGIGKRLAGLLGSEQVDKIKNIGTEAIGDLLGNLSGSKGEEKDDSSTPPPPSGKRFDEPAPPQAPAVDTSNPPAPKANPTSGTASLADKILELNKLREQGVLTDAEFAALKNELLDS